MDPAETDKLIAAALTDEGQRHALGKMATALVTQFDVFEGDVQRLPSERVLVDPDNRDGCFVRVEKVLGPP